MAKAKLEQIIDGAQMLERLAPPAEDKKDEQFYDECSRMLLDEICSHGDKAWADRVRVALEEKGWSAQQFIFNCVAQVLDRGAHLEVTSHPYVQTGIRVMGERGCERCRKVFVPDVPGQRFCSNECGMAHFRDHKPPQPEPRNAPIQVVPAGR